MKDDSRREKLLSLGPEQLTDLLLKAAQMFEPVDEMLTRAVAAPDERIDLFKVKLAAIKRSKRFIGYREAYEFALEIDSLLELLREGISDPTTGLKLLKSFYDADASILNRCDDSSGCIRPLFCNDAQQLFEQFARQCDDKKFVAKTVLQLISKNNYSTRDEMVTNIASYLPEQEIRELIRTLEKKAGTAENDAVENLHWIMRIARSLKDAELYEKTARAIHQDMPVYLCIKIGRVYLESGNFDKALSWANEKKEDTFQQYEREELLQDIYTGSGDTEKLIELRTGQFQKSPSKLTLGDLVKLLGEEERPRLIKEAVQQIMQQGELSLSSISFLLETGEIDSAEQYLLDRAEQLDGYDYDRLPEYAKHFEKHDRLLACSLIYRCLLDSILQRAYTKAYSYGARYLKKLDKLAAEITDWERFPDHGQYTQKIRTQHKLKRSFWGKYE